MLLMTEDVCLLAQIQTLETQTFKNTLMIQPRLAYKHAQPTTLEAYILELACVFPNAMSIHCLLTTIRQRACQLVLHLKVLSATKILVRVWMFARLTSTLKHLQGIAWLSVGMEPGVNP